MSFWQRHKTVPTRHPVRLMVPVLIIALMIGQIGPFRSENPQVQALSFVRQWMYVSLTSDTLNVRGAPSTSAVKIDYLNNGHRVYVWTKENNDGLDWYLITYISNNTPRTGYVAAQYVQPLVAGTSSDFEAGLERKVFPRATGPLCVACTPSTPTGCSRPADPASAGLRPSKMKWPISAAGFQ
jgi:hypothetical protein